MVVVLLMTTMMTTAEFVTMTMVLLKDTVKL